MKVPVGILRRFPVTLALAFLPGPHASAQTVQDFDSPGTRYDLGLCILPPAVSVTADGPTGRFLRLVTSPSAPAQNTITFDRTDAGAFTFVVADFDFRHKPLFGRSDGFSFALLNTHDFPDGAVCPQGAHAVAEEPDFTGSLGIGFDTFQNLDWRDPSDNHVSVHFNGDRLIQADVKDLDLAGGHWIHARILIRMRPAGGPLSDVSVILTPPGRRPVTVLGEFPVPGLVPYEGRAHFAARSGGQAADDDLDNIRLQFSNGSPSLLAFESPSYAAVETDPVATVAVVRSGDSSTRVRVQYSTADLTATADADYIASSGMLTFEPGETRKTLTVPIVNDRITEPDEMFRVRLSDPDGGALLAGPATATVSLVDDESARNVGHWSDVLMWPFVAIHMALLPTGTVMFWEDKGHTHEVGVWDPATGSITTPALPGHDIFCSGHSFLADGSLFVTGGHVSMPFDGHLGLPTAALYNPFTNAWSGAPDMNAARWYPTNTTLANGDVLVISGDMENVPPKPFIRNSLPQVWQPRTGTWRDLTAAQSPAAHGGDLYPRMFLAPDGRVFKAGPDADTWFLDPSGHGAWSRGPLTNRGRDATVPASNRLRSYGPAVIRDGKVFIFGGAEFPPTNSVESLDLKVKRPAWVQLPPMAEARRHHNATFLPDGTILITGGTSAPGFNDGRGAVMGAELFDPDTNTWSRLPSMRVRRVYHSTALLLPDGRVVSAGGGRPEAFGDHDHRDAEVYSPAYLFKGPRPAITDAPVSVVIGQTFDVQTPDAADIAKVSLIRLGAVTHSIDMNQRYLTLPFSVAAGGLQLTVPSNPNICPPGHYMLFLVNRSGVPSVAKIIQVALEGQ